MKTKGIPFFLLLAVVGHLSAQPRVETPSISNGRFTVFNRHASYGNGEVHMNANKGGGILWLNGSRFENGVIELELKGRNTPGRSFVGLAFHGKDETSYDAIYFRPFNFLIPDRNDHSVQYISLPGNDWSTLREKFPGRYENQIDPVPSPVDTWFHVKIDITYPYVKVYVNHAARPTLEIRQLSKQKEGKIGFWVGNGSEGWFRNLKITHAD